jgi:hypothetical protein
MPDVNRKQPCGKQGLVRAWGVVVGAIVMAVLGASVAHPADPVAAAAVSAVPATHSVAVLDEPGMPQRGAPASPETIAQILSDGGMRVERLTATQFGDPSQLNTERFDLIVLPTGETFPIEARENVLMFLRGGGEMITLGGYAFQDLVRNVQGKWVPEQEAAAARLTDATQPARSLLSDGGFEDPQDVPIGTEAIDGTWRRSAASAYSTDESPWRGAQCAKVVVEDETGLGSGGYAARVRVTPGRQYRVVGSLRTTQQTGPGMAYIALYQFDAQGQIVDFRDFAVVRAPGDWQTYLYSFIPSPRVDHVRVQFGFYRQSGTAYFDEVHLFDVTDALFQPMNTATGEPGDGLRVRPEQLGMFDPSYPLKRVVRVRTAGGQAIVQATCDESLSLSGWAASGVLGSHQSRWVPLLEACDRYGHLRGPVGALVLHHGGHYAKSHWAFFGADNVDLFSQRDGAGAQVLRETARFLTRQCYLRGFRAETALAQPGDSISVRVHVHNDGKETQNVRVCLEWEPSPALPSPERVTHTAVVPAGGTEEVVEQLIVPPADANLARLHARLVINDVAVDQMETAVVVRSEAAMQAGPALRFVDNYFRLGERPMFLFGTDTYARTYPAARDIGLNLYENLQYQRPGHVMEDEDWRKFRALAQLCQQRGLVFMPGMLVGHNTAIGPEMLAEQSRLCAAYAERMRDVPALLYYINGDYQLILNEHPADVRREWQRWLESQYASIAALRSAWGREDLPETWDAMEYPPADSGRWDDRARIDDVCFRTELTTRWNRSHVAAVRSWDSVHAITSEYYSDPSEGIDLRLTIGGQDVSNIGFFDRPERDLETLPWKMAFADLRATGQGVSLGEYGVKTHLAWSEINGASGYHIRRTEAEQKRLFEAVAHYGFGLGCSKVQNWCLRDDTTWVFPWGLFYPHQFVPKDVAYVHRNQSLALRCLEPKYVTPPVLVCLASHMRLGNDSRLGAEVAYRTSADLLALHVPFGSIDDTSLSQVSTATRLLILPSPFVMSDEVFFKLRSWVEQGGALLVTGDLSYDPARQPTRHNRLEELCGVRLRKRNYEHVRRDAGAEREAVFVGEDSTEFRGAVRPCLDMDPTGAVVLGTDVEGQPVFVQHRLGQGQVFFCSDPLELAPDDATSQLRRTIYTAVLHRCGVTRNAVEPDEPWLHVMRQPTSQGLTQVIYHTQPSGAAVTVSVPTAGEDVRLEVRPGGPALVSVTDAGRIVLLNTHGSASVAGESICGGTGQRMLLSLDGADLRASRAMLVLPIEAGEVVLPARPGEFTAFVGDFAGGEWKVAETLPLTGAAWRLPLDEDRATMIVLICPTSELAQWTSQLNVLLQSPNACRGY